MDDVVIVILNKGHGMVIDTAIRTSFSVIRSSSSSTRTSSCRIGGDSTLNSARKCASQGPSVTFIRALHAQFPFHIRQNSVESHPARILAHSCIRSSYTCLLGRLSAWNAQKACSDISTCSDDSVDIGFTEARRTRLSTRHSPSNHGTI